MKDKLPYEDWLSDKLNDLPLPDQEASWLQMKKLLEEDKKKRRLLPPFWLNGCVGGLLLLLAGISLWWFAFQQKDRPQSENKKERKTIQQAPNTTAVVNRGSNEKVITAKENKQATINHSQPTTNLNGKHTAVSLSIQTPTKTGTNVNKVITTPNATAFITAKKSTSNRLRKKSAKTTRQFSTNVEVPVAQNTSAATHDPRQSGNTPDQTDTNSLSGKRDTGQVKPAPKDSLEKQAASEKSDRPAKTQIGKRFYLSAGLGLTQQIPVAGQKATPCNHYGRKASLADYVPSVYLRLHRDSKWFLHSELRYGAPQYAREFTYSNIKIDSFGTEVTRQSLTLKKTFYHQLLLGYQQHLHPNWSVGGGMMFSRFYGAVSEQEIRKQTIGNPNETVLSRKLMQVPATTDSFFTRTHMQLMLETEYRYKRVSLGGRYTQGLQPYIKYSTPAGAQKKETNRSLQLFLRLKIWQQKKAK